MYARNTAADSDAPPPGTHAYSAYLAARQVALGLMEAPAPTPAQAPVVEEPAAPVEEPPAPIVERPAAPAAEGWVWVGPTERAPAGPGCAEGSVLGCGLGREHHCHWIWWGRIGRFVCSTCEPGRWFAIPKAKHDPLDVARFARPNRASKSTVLAQ